LLALSFKSLGVIYGDIATSPLYVFGGIFDSSSPPSADRVLGVISCIIWSLTLILILKYCFIILFADDHGEGGTFALYSLLCRHIGIVQPGQPLITLSRDGTIGSCTDAKGLSKSKLATSPRAQRWLLTGVLFCASLVIGDGVLTPAVSVLSAVEALQIQVPEMEPVVVPLTCLLILMLFAVQKYGTDRIGKGFAPIVSVWLGVLLYTGVQGIMQDPRILRALSPWYAVRYFAQYRLEAWESLGGILLAMTGAEALFADLGHFSRPAIQVSATLVVFPTLVIQYLGQGAQLLHQPELISEGVGLFWRTVPQAIYWPTFVIATLSTIIASQAMITATFSILQQAIALDCFPPLRILHTSKRVRGQVYLPLVNWSLAIATLTVVCTFRSSSALTNAYGVAVSGVMLLSNLFMYPIIRSIWRAPWILALAYVIGFGALDLAFFSSTLIKALSGAWLPLSLALGLSLLMQLWRWSFNLRAERALDADTSLEALLDLGAKGAINGVPFLQAMSDPSSTTGRGGGGGGGPLDAMDLTIRTTGVRAVRTPGLILFHADTFSEEVPRVFPYFLHRFTSVPHRVVFLHPCPIPTANVVPEDHLSLSPLSIPGFYRCDVRTGYADPCMDGSMITEWIYQQVRLIEGIRRDMSAREGEEEGEEEALAMVTHVVGREEVYAHPESGRIRRYMLETLARRMQGSGTGKKMSLPHEQVVEFGMHVVI
ncbi:potassium transporter, partial [Piptocephalis cylindrospora]